MAEEQPVNPTPAQEFKMEFLMKSANDTISFNIGASLEENLQGFFMEFFQVFPGAIDFDNGKINALMTVTTELRDNLKNFVAAHESKMKGLNAVEAFVRKLADGELFYVIPDFRPTAEQSTRLHYYLQSGGDAEVFTELNRQTEELFGDLFEAYHIHAYGYKPLTIGELDKTKRVCRFCKRGMPEVTFKKKAHAISEAFGNKFLVLREECDECNQRFATTIEPDMVEYFSLLRTIYDIKGKGGSKEYHGANFDITRDGQLKIDYIGDEDEDKAEAASDTTDVPEPILLKSSHQVSRQNIYRTLVKFALSVMESAWLPHFDKTVKWVNGEFDLDALPPVAVFFFPDKLATQPTLTLYLRKTDDTDLPFAVGEFQYAFSRYSFIIPCADADSKTFTNKENYDHFWKKFKHYHLMEKQAKFINLTDADKRDFEIKITFELNKDKPN
jgi:hypothetical protein